METEIATRLIKSRKAKNWTQQQLSEASHIGITVISGLENVTRTLTNSTALALADALGVSPEYLFCKTDNPKGVDDFDLRYEFATDVMLVMKPLVKKYGKDMVASVMGKAVEYIMCEMED